MLAIERLFATERVVWSVPLAIAVGMPVLSGWVQSWAYSLYVLAGYTALKIVLVHRDTREAGRTARLASLAAFGAVAGVALAAAQLIPSLELMSLGPRRPGSLSVSRILVLGPTGVPEMPPELPYSGRRAPLPAPFRAVLDALDTRYRDWIVRAWDH